MENLISLKDKIFIAGHNGMVGSAILRSLKRKGYLNICHVEKRNLDLSNQLDVDNWFKLNKPDVVILAAAKVGGIIANATYPADFIFDNIKIQTNVIESAKNNGVKRFLFLGSSCIYPKVVSQPIKEEYLLSGSLEKTNDAYAIAKIAGIKMCEALTFQYGFDAICLMPTNLYGPNDNFDSLNSHVFASFTRKFHEAVLKKHSILTLWGSGKTKREFLHVDDLADACVLCLEKFSPFINNNKNNGVKPINYLNVGYGEDISIYDLSILFKDISGFKGLIKWDLSKPDGTFRKLLDISKIKKLGWEPKIKLKDGIKSALDYYKKISKNF